MNDGPATLEATAHPEAIKPAGQPAQRGSGMKFMYASGSTPLDGYTIKRGVGIGGFGEVYFAVSTAGKEVALKRVQRNLEIELRGVSQCLNLKHPNLVDLYDIRHDSEGGAWVVMEYVAGESLKDVLDRNPSGLPVDEVLTWFTGIAEGVAYLHDQGIVHRDLKPGNIFNDQGYIKIGDYGLSKFISASRRSGHTESVGTFHYMAPEIGKGSYGREIDVYALGVILHELLTGKVPFDGESSQEIIMRHLTEDADVSRLPQPFRDVVAKALVKDPELRTCDVREMLSALIGTSARSHANSHDHVVNATRVDDVFYIDGKESPPDMQFGPLQQRRKTPPTVNAAANPVHTQRVPQPVAVAPREPIAQKVTAQAQKLSTWWQDSRIGTGLKVLVGLTVVSALVLGGNWFLPLVGAAGVIYATYLGIWMLVQALSVSSPEPSTGIRFRSWQELTREQLRAKPLGDRVGELTGSWIGAALVNALLAIVMVAIADKLVSTVDAASYYAWLTVSATLGTWAVLAVGKYCEGVEGEAVRRRLVMLACGLIAGIAVFYLDDFLRIPLSISQSTQMESLASSEGTPRLPLFLLYLGGLFAIPGWWKQTDPMRRTRMNLFWVAACVFWAWILQLALPFPQPWGLMLAAMMSISAQLASPWMTARERDAAKQEFRRV